MIWKGETYTYFQWNKEKKDFQIQYLTLDTWPDNIHDAVSTENTGMKHRFHETQVCLHFSTDEFEPLCYLMVTCNFNYKEPIHMRSDLTISLNQLVF